MNSSPTTIQVQDRSQKSSSEGARAIHSYTSHQSQFQQSVETPALENDDDRTTQEEEEQSTFERDHDAKTAHESTNTDHQRKQKALEYAPISVEASNTNPKHPRRDCGGYVPSFLSEIQAIAFDSARSVWRNVETGGSLYGWYLNNQFPFIALATHAGKKAVRESAFFSEDLDEFNKTQSLLLGRYACQLIGTWHKHPPGMPYPSSTDKQNAKSILKKNRLRSYLQIIVTVNDHRPRNDSERSEAPQVSMKGFLYTPGCSEPEDISFKAIQERSWIREALAQSSDVEGFDADIDYPLDCIHLSLEGDGQSLRPLPEPLQEQAARFPDAIQNAIRHRFHRDGLDVAIPVVPEGRFIFVFSNPDEPVLQNIYRLTKNRSTPMLQRRCGGLSLDNPKRLLNWYWDSFADIHNSQ